jgi:hypothetical protein
VVSTEVRSRRRLRNPGPGHERTSTRVTFSSLAQMLHDRSRHLDQQQEVGQRCGSSRWIASHACSSPTCIRWRISLFSSVQDE